jgi:hypothetical protein
VTLVLLPVAVAVDVPEPPAKKGKLKIEVHETSSGDPVEGVTVKITGPSGAEKVTDSTGTAEFPELIPGAYKIDLQQDKFEMKPTNGGASAVPGEETVYRLDVARIALFLAIKRIHIQGIWKAAGGNKSELEYGHWWIEIEGTTSYGWWPLQQVSIKGTFTGVEGALNRFPKNPHPLRDPHHGDDDAKERFHPRVERGDSASAIKACIVGFATSYSGKWSWPWGQNCHSFQEDLMEHCELTKSGSKAIK